MLTCTFPCVGEQVVESTTTNQSARGSEFPDAEYEAAVRGRRSFRQPGRITISERCEPCAVGGNSRCRATAARCARCVATGLQRSRLLRGGGSDDEVEVKTNSCAEDTNHHSLQCQ